MSVSKQVSVRQCARMAGDPVTAAVGTVRDRQLMADDSDPGPIDWVCRH
jgi:hypothetical protein